MNFVKVFDKDKNSEIILNMEFVETIIPLTEGGCSIVTTSKNLIKVTDSYDLFNQFVIQKVTVGTVNKIVEKTKDIPKEDHPKLQNFSFPDESIAKVSKKNGSAGPSTTTATL